MPLDRECKFFDLEIIATYSLTYLNKIHASFWQKKSIITSHYSFPLFHIRKINYLSHFKQESLSAKNKNDCVISDKAYRYNSHVELTHSEKMQITFFSNRFSSTQLSLIFTITSENNYISGRITIVLHRVTHFLTNWFRNKWNSLAVSCQQVNRWKDTYIYLSVIVVNRRD